MRLSLETRKYILWADCQANGWTRSARDILASLTSMWPNDGWTMAQIANTVHKAKWSDRFPGSGAVQRQNVHSRKFDDSAIDLVDLFAV